MKCCINVAVLMVGIILDYYVYQRSYSTLKSKNLVKFCVHISPIFSCLVTYNCAAIMKNICMMYACVRVCIEFYEACVCIKLIVYGLFIIIMFGMVQ